MRQKGFRIDIGKKMFRAVRHCSRLLKEVMESPSLEVFKRYLDLALDDAV